MSLNAEGGKPAHKLPPGDVYVRSLCQSMSADRSHGLVYARRGSALNLCLCAITAPLKFSRQVAQVCTGVRRATSVRLCDHFL